MGTLGAQGTTRTRTTKQNKGYNASLVRRFKWLLEPEYRARPSGRVRKGREGVGEGRGG